MLFSLPKTDPKSLHSLLRFIDGPSLFFLNLPNCPSSKESALVFVDYITPYFSVSQPKTLHSRARGYLSELRPATCPEKSHSFFCFSFSSAEFLAAATNLSLSSFCGPDQVSYFMLKHLSRYCMDFLLLHVFNLSWPLHSFFSSGKISSIIPIHNMGKPLDSPASFRPISLIYCVSKLFERIILSRLLFDLESNTVLSLCQAGFHPAQFTLDQIFFGSYRMGLTNPSLALGQFFLRSTTLEVSALSGIPLFSKNIFRLASLKLCSLLSIFPFQ